ncbi:MAG: hypothetical protein HQL59_13575 [Magnetococcales bacterium]|nr:hypothetical protein [Magnetococcales bacterium]
MADQAIAADPGFLAAGAAVLLASGEKDAAPLALVGGQGIHFRPLHSLWLCFDRIFLVMAVPFFHGPH